MPIYEYVCLKCNRVHEKLEHAPNTKKCPYCGHIVKRIYSPVGLVFKGHGFYTTDYKTNAST